LADAFSRLATVSAPLFSYLLVTRLHEINVEVDEFLREHHSLMPHFSILLLHFLLDMAEKQRVGTRSIKIYA
jgi:hypothetical protein